MTNWFPVGAVAGNLADYTVARQRAVDWLEALVIWRATDGQA